MNDKGWEEVKRSFLGPLSNDEIDQIEYTAYLVALLRRRREELGYTQEQVAQKAGIPQSSIARLENGGAIPRLDTVYRVARALGMRLVLVEDEEAASVAI
jgi:DNA-binding XRE family transcriptional regulator